VIEAQFGAEAASPEGRDPRAASSERPALVRRPAPRRPYQGRSCVLCAK
jgi:hypothetical protein